MQTDFGPELNALADRYYGAGEPEKKPSTYFVEYDRLFSPIRSNPIRLLELGVRSGASMLVWRDYFPTATIVGLDIDECPPNFPKEVRFHFIAGSQDDHSALDEAIRIAGGPFDIIIDDASHVGHITARSLAYLFPGGLKDGGFYVIEDICTAFLVGVFPEAEAYNPAKLGQPGEVNIFPSHQNGMIGLVKQIFDHVMSPVAVGAWSPYAVERMLILANIAILQKTRLSRSVELPAEFDPIRYLELNPDVAAAGADPVRHYLDFGWREGRRLR
jgi:hypothetical protein